MRIIIDLQGAQTESRFRGIGRYTMSFVQAIARNRGKHDVILALNGLFPETIEFIRAAFNGLLPCENIRVWKAPGPVREDHQDNDTRREIAELIREAFLASLEPDVIHLCSLFEGYVDDAVTSIGRLDCRTPVSVTLHDLIPLMNPDRYLHPNPRYNQYYQRKIDFLKEAALCLAVSEHSRQEGMTHLNIPVNQIVNTSEAVEHYFQPVYIHQNVVRKLKKKFGLQRPFVLYTGGDDERKNLTRLIQAFAALPNSLRSRHQLLLAGKMHPGNIDKLKHDAKTAGLKPNELCFTGYVTDEELVQLYNLCHLFVFPSWHEGFGLPVLEAMACGAPVICAGASSLPEVIGLEDALFDPFDVAAITAKMAMALENDDFCAALCHHGLQQAKRFSWDDSAKRAIAAWESLQTARSMHQPSCPPAERKLKLAFVSPLPPERTGIADYSAELLPALAAHYDIEIVVAQDKVDDPWVNKRAILRDISWLRAHANEIDRVLYQIGNSPYHQHMISLLREIPGTVVLHDFFMSGLIAWLELYAGAENVWTHALYSAHGYNAVCERFGDPDEAKRIYPVNLHILQYAKGLIVHSEYSRKLAAQWYGEAFVNLCTTIPSLRSPAGAIEKMDSRKKLGVDPTEFLVCSFGFLDSTKLNHRLLHCWLNSALARDRHCRLVFVGENQHGDYGKLLRQMMRTSGLDRRIRITGFASPKTFRKYLMAADIAVQLRTHSRGETSAAVLDCMNYALPLIVNANGSMGELNTDAVWMLPDEFEDDELITALETLWRDPEKRGALGKHARKIIQNHHSPTECARLYADAIERFHRRYHTTTEDLIREIAANQHFKPNDFDLQQIARDISATLPLRRPSKRLLLDISATSRNDLKTGIERVARSLLLALIKSPPVGFRTEPVYLSDAEGAWHYRYASRYTLDLLGCPPDTLEDDIVEADSGDVVLTLDLSGDMLIQADSAGLLMDYRNRGVRVYAVVFDLLPVLMPEVFPPGADRTHAQWLQTISKFDGAICISKAVAHDLAQWQKKTGLDWRDRRPFRIGWFHLGADVSNSAPSKGMPAGADAMLDQLRLRPSFLMVGTIEPRKGYLQALEAFSVLWNEGRDVNLVIVGKEGWKGLPDDMRRDIPQTTKQLRNHPELNTRLFWCDSISDEYLENIYEADTCLIAASYGEGFGLPLIEAARHGIPLIARDIPVFREVAGDNAFYFKGEKPSDLAMALKSWFVLKQEERHPRSEKLCWSTWQGSVEELKVTLFQENEMQPQLLVDISELVQRDARSGIQRVVRSILTEWLNHPPSGYRVEPVYATIDHGYRYARRFTQAFLGHHEETLQDDVIEYARGDVFFGLDLQPHVIPAHRAFYQALRRHGVRVEFLVPDMLCIQMPQYFLPDSGDIFSRWLQVVVENDGAVCISKAVADELAHWVKRNGASHERRFTINWFHLGADIDNSAPTNGLPQDADYILDQLLKRKSFLMVSTLEPRKGHEQVLEAFEQLWPSVADINLVIVGKQGWMVDNLIKRLRQHPELNRRLFWLDGISDEYLEKVYGASTCLISASYGEGFGLPLIEAAQHKVPIIVRNIPVSREVAGEHAYYFEARTPNDLAQAIKMWLALYDARQHPDSETLPWLTWRESVQQLSHVILSKT